MASSGAWNAGWSLGAQLAQERRAHQEALTDQEFQMHAQRLADELQGNRDQLSRLDPHSSEYTAKLADLQRNLQDIRLLYHPDHRPDAVSRFGHLITDRLGITNPQQRIRAVAAKRAADIAEDEREAQNLAAATPQPLNKFVQLKREMETAGFSPEDIATALRGSAGLVPKDATEQERFVTQYKIDHKGATDEDALKVYARATAKPTAPKGMKALEQGGVAFGVENQDTGQQYLASQLGPNGDAPPEAKQIWSTIQKVLADKQTAQDKKQQEEDERQLRGLAAIAERMGRSEEFQEQMAGFREQLGEYKTLDQQARKTQTLVDTYTAQYAQPGNKSAVDTALLTDYTSVLAQGGRKTQAEINLARSIGSFQLNWEERLKKAATGELPDELRKLYLDYLTAAAKAQRADANAAKPEMPQLPAPTPGGLKKRAAQNLGNDPLGVLP